MQRNQREWLHMEGVVSNRLLLQTVGATNMAQPDSVVSYVQPQRKANREFTNLRLSKQFVQLYRQSS